MSIAKTRPSWSFALTPTTIHGVLEVLIVVDRAFTSALRGHRELDLKTSR
jgi:hypothetical protein